jgi:hypothetical protein
MKRQIINKQLATKDANYFKRIKQIITQTIQNILTSLLNNLSKEATKVKIFKAVSDNKIITTQLLLPLKELPNQNQHLSNYSLLTQVFIRRFQLFCVNDFFTFTNSTNLFQ